MILRRSATGQSTGSPSWPPWQHLPVRGEICLPGSPTMTLTCFFLRCVVGYDTAVIGGTMALDSFRRDFGVENMEAGDRDAAQANIASMFQVGAFFGSLLTFPFAEKYGRKKAIMLACAIFIVGGSMMAAAHGYLEILIAGRAIGGLGIGMATMTVPVYIAETSPPSIRGRLVGIFEIVSQGGGMLGFWINYAVDRTIDVRLQSQWITPLALQCVPAACLLMGVTFCPESPRWLARSDNFDAAEKSLCYIRGLPASHPYIINEMQDIRLQVEERSTNRMSKRQQIAKVFAPGTRNRIAIGAFLVRTSWSCPITHTSDIWTATEKRVKMHRTGS